MRTRLSFVFGTIMAITIGIGIANHVAYAAKLTASSYSDGYSRGVNDASRDLQGLNGHGHDSSCPSGHTSVFCDGYEGVMMQHGMEEVSVIHRRLYPTQKVRVKVQA